MWKKKGTIKFDKRIVTCDIITASCEDGTVKCEKKKNTKCEKVLLNVILKLHNVRMKPSNMRKNKGTTKCDKSTVKCDVRIAQYEDEIVKCEKI